jgi:cytoskeleton protein RodZ
VLQDRWSNLVDGSSMMSRVEPAMVAPRAGADLRAARERLGMSVSEASAMLRIRPAYLDALEEGALSRLPGNAYALGFLRSYAAALGLEPTEILRRFKTEAAEVTQKTDLVFPAPVPERGMPTGAVIMLGLVLAVGAYIGWYRLSGEGRLPAETATAIPAQLAPLAEQALPPAVPPQPRPAATPIRVSVEPVTPGPMLSPSSAAAALVTPMPAEPPVVSPPPPLADGTRIVLRANADAWIQVREKAGKVILDRVLKPGESWPVPARPGLLLTLGNAAGTEILVDGTVTVPPYTAAAFVAAKR